MNSSRVGAGVSRVRGSVCNPAAHGWTGRLPVAGTRPLIRVTLSALIVGVLLQFPPLQPARAATRRSIAQSSRVQGEVKDSSGAAVQGATVTLAAGPTLQKTVTGADGGFTFQNIPAASGSLTVAADGFAEITRDWHVAGDGTASVNVHLTPVSPSEQMTVSAARTEMRVSDSAAAIVVLSSQDLATTAAATLDDALRQVEGFTLFRRSGSRTSNPTTQGVSLRGVGASGASRALVLVDGVPLNDPFGGWIYWGRVPQESIERIEVLQGAASSLYGTDALGGVIDIIQHDPHESIFSLEGAYGNETTPQGSLFMSGRTGNWIGTVGAQAFRTDGYIIVDPSQRGLVDTPAGVRYSDLDVTVERLIGANGRAFFRGATYGESRENGTPVQTNRTHMREFVGGLNWNSAAAGNFAVRLYGGSEVFDQNSSSVAANRATELLSRSQRSPSEQIGLTSQWSHSAGTRQTIVAGFDARQVRGSSDDLIATAGKITSAEGDGGRQHTFGVFGEDIIRITPRTVLTLGARVDHWRNFDAQSVTRSFATNVPIVKPFVDRSESAFSPRVSIMQRLNENWSVSASVYRAFRAPTLNELYRTFRVGNIITQSNSNLNAEHLTGGEAGTSFTALRQRLNIRGTFFWSEIDQAVENVTIATTPTVITRQRQNLGLTRSRGVEADASARITNTITFSAGYLYTDATVLSGPLNPNLTGLWVPQIPRQEFTFQGRYENPSLFTLAFQGRVVTQQFDDDLNQFPLGRFFVLDGYLSRRINRQLEVFAAAENLLDQRYAVGLTPTKTIGPPILGRIGFRLTLGAR